MPVRSVWQPLILPGKDEYLTTSGSGLFHWLRIRANLAFRSP